MAANDPLSPALFMDNQTPSDMDECLSVPLPESEERSEDEDRQETSNDWDFYGTNLEVEDLVNYVKGGYCPVHIGDIFLGRYRIIHKLGHGGSGTVWLACDDRLRRYVALKILCADLSTECHDVRMSDYLKEQESDHPGRQYIALVLDHFELDSANGRHLCLVSEILGPTISGLALLDKQLRGSVARKVARQLVETVAFLHSVGVCHGDLTVANVALKLASLDSCSEEDIYNMLGKPELETLRRASGKEIPPSVPRYVVASASFNNVGAKWLESEIRLMDFGIAFFANEPPIDLGTPPNFTAPEIWFEKAASWSTDIWALGCCLYTIRSNAMLFEITWGGTPVECIGGIVEVLGAPPEKWDCLYFNEEGLPVSREEICEGEDVPPWVTEEQGQLPRVPLAEIAANVADEYHGPPRSEDSIPREKLPHELEMEARGCYITWPEAKPSSVISNKEAELFGDLLGKLIKWEPEHRSSAKDMLEHGWFVTEIEDAKTASDAPPLFQS